MQNISTHQLAAFTVFLFSFFAGIAPGNGQSNGALEPKKPNQGTAVHIRLNLHGYLLDSFSR